jgi:hypothetical protein
MQKSNAPGQREQDAFTPVPVKPDQELAKAILKALPAITKLLNQK